MSTFKSIEKKLHQFTKKYYVNELIKGVILFFSLGFLYLFFTLFLEYFLWLKPTARTLLFWVFILVEMFLLIRFIALPIFKLIGFKKGISLEESSQIIGNHFPEVSDKLLNVLQLQESEHQSDLLLASIEQKATELQPIPFVNAVNFKHNLHYLKYALFPVLIFVIIWLSGNITIFNTSFKRVVDYRTAYVPPAPFSFQLQNSTLKVIQGKPIDIRFKTVGNVVPTDVKIHFNNQSYFLQNKLTNEFTYTFTNTNNSIDFFVDANGVSSQNYTLEVVPTPTIQNVSIKLEYPSYIKKKNEVIENTGNILIPEGTHVFWKVATMQTDTVSFFFENKKYPFNITDKNVFSFDKKIDQSVNYQIGTSNKALHDYEKLQFKIDVIKDEFPRIEVVSDVDSLSNHMAQFAGKISDDYGISTLEMVYYNADNPSVKKTKSIPVDKVQEAVFYDIFPGDLNIDKGVNYKVYFQVFDNDGVNGKKKSISKEFSFRNKTNKEIEQEVLQSQRNQIHTIENSIEKQKNQKATLEEIKQNLQNSKNVNWDDKKKIDNFIKRQEQYNEMMQRQTDKLQQNLDNQPKDTESIQQKKEALKQRIEELKKLEKEQKLLEELKKLANKLNKEDLLNRVKKLAEQNKQQERSLERILELTKRFYVEQKTMQVAIKLKDLAKKQDSLQKEPTINKEKQQAIKDEFEAIKKELEDLQNDNKALKEPMEIPDVKEAEKETETNLNKAQDSNKEQKERKESQKKAVQKMQEMGEQMEQAMMDMESDMKEANKESLRIILENLLNFSFKQEDLMNTFSKIDVTHPNFGKELKNQNTLKTYFEHIDDSLYVLSMRLPEISVKIQKDLTEAHYNIDQSLENFADNKFASGVSNQQYIMTAVNNLADFLSDILDNMQQPKNSNSGKGKKGGKSFSLPDIIQKQSDLIKKMQEGNKNGEQNRKQKGGKKGNDNGEDSDGDLYEIYQQQTQLRQELQNALKRNQNSTNPAVQKILKSMEELENEILEKGFNLNTVERMQELQYNLLKLDKAAFEQENDTDRKSETNQYNYPNTKQQLNFKKLFFNQTEILNRQSLPLQKIYKKKVQEYFKLIKETTTND